MPGEEGGAECVKVAVRCRPPSTKELNAGEHSIVEMVEAFTPEAMGTGQVILSDPSGAEEPQKFAFDIVFGLTIKQSDIYGAVGRPALMKTFEGYNGTIFAYGQTGSGKSFSMSGAEGDLRGIIPRVNEELFERIAAEQVGTKKYLVMCSYFEIYNEIIFDLLNPVSDRSKLGGGLQIKEHPVLGIYVKDLTEIVAEDANKLEDMIASGSKARAVSSTMMNATSSRSHSIFTIKVHQKDEEDTSRNVFAKLNLVDLAGSERQKGTGATGQTLKEGANINKSLSALGNVINALVECANGKKIFIPYRNSKLTRVLQESLGGNSLCTMLAMMSPAACNFDETVSTLRYANRAKAIKVSATKNEEASQISRLKAEVEELKKKLQASGTGGGGGSAGLTDAERATEKANYERQLKDMESMLNSNWGEKARMSEEHERNLQKIAEEQRLAAQALEEERARRLRLLQEKNDLELSVRGLIDFVLHLPRFNNPPPVITGEQPRQWLKSYRSLRLLVDELKDQCTMVLVFKHAFDEDIRLWGEGAEANDMAIAATGLTRCVPKLDKLRKGGEKLLQLQVEGLSTASNIADSVRQAITDLEKVMKDTRSEAEADPADAGKANKGAALDEVRHMLGLVQQQVQEKIEEIEKKSEIEMGQTCEIVLQFSRSCSSETGIDEQVMRDCEALQALIADPSLAGLPASMPSKPLREYTPTDVQDTPETTEALLGQLIRWEGLCGGKTRKTALELLTRPPPKFLLDVTISVKAMTGYPPELDPDWPEAREERLARFMQIANTVGSTLGCAIDFDPADVLKGKEVSKTLRLLQLLGIAAARYVGAEGSKASDNARQLGVTRPRELPAMLDCMMNCIQDVKGWVERQRQAATVAANGDLSLEEKIATLQRQLDEQARSRLRQEEVLADAERNLQEMQAEQKRLAKEYELNMTASGPDPEQLDLERQIQDLMRDAAQPAEIPEEAVLRLLTQQIEEVKRALAQDEGAVFELEEKKEDLERSVQTVLQETKAVEAEVQRERQRREMEDELMGQSPEEQKLILEAHEQKLRMRVETLEDQIAGMQKEAAERKVLTERRLQERVELQRQVEEAHLQIQIVQEERDAMREAMEQLFNEKAAVDEELEDRQQAYIHLTERVNRINDETCELQDLLAQRMAEAADWGTRAQAMEAQGLQKNGFHVPGIAAA